MKNVPIGQYMVNKGIITEEQLQNVLEAKKKENVPGKLRLLYSDAKKFFSVAWFSWAFPARAGHFKMIFAPRRPPALRRSAPPALDRAGNDLRIKTASAFMATRAASGPPWATSLRKRRQRSGDPLRLRPAIRQGQRQQHAPP